MNHDLKKTLKSAFEAPAPTRKNHFLSQLDYPKSSRLDFIKTQVGYIRKRVWFLSVLLFIGTLLGLYCYQVSPSFVWGIASLLPFISLVSMNEIFLSATYHMEELEMSCKHNLLELMLTRMGLLGVGNLLVLIGVVFLFERKVDFGFFRLGLYLTTPFLLNCYGSLFVANRLKSRQIAYVCGGVTSFVSLLNILLTVHINTIYTERYWILWKVVFVILVAFSTIEILKLIKKVGELQWSLELID